MINKMIAKMRGVSALAALGSALAVMSVTAIAAAAVQSGSPILIQSYPGQVLIQLNIAGTPTNFIGQVTPLCGAAVNIDTQKAYLSLAETALVSGKRLNIGYTTCTPSGQSYQLNVINGIDLVQ